MRWLRRLVVVPFALVLAVTASSLFLVAAAAADPVMGPFAGEVLWVGFWSLMDSVFAADDPRPFVDAALADAARLVATVLLAPPVVVALAGEIVGARSVLWYAGGTALLTGALPWLARGGMRPATPEEIRIAAVLALTGAVAGLVYWLVAGRGAAAEPRQPATVPRSPGS